MLSGPSHGIASYEDYGMGDSPEGCWRCYGVYGR